jgi:hypothetical protein
MIPYIKFSIIDFTEQQQEMISNTYPELVYWLFIKQSKIPLLHWYILFQDIEKVKLILSTQNVPHPYLSGLYMVKHNDIIEDPVVLNGYELAMFTKSWKMVTLLSDYNTNQVTSKSVYDTSEYWDNIMQSNDILNMMNHPSLF